MLHGLILRDINQQNGQWKNAFLCCPFVDASGRLLYRYSRKAKSILNKHSGYEQIGQVARGERNRNNIDEKEGKATPLSFRFPACTRTPPVSKQAGGQAGKRY